MTWAGSTKLGRVPTRGAKGIELVSNENTPLHKFWSLIQNGATCIRVKDSRGWRYDFECTLEGAAAATADRNVVSNVRLVFKPKRMESEEDVSIRQVSIVSANNGSTKVTSFCFDIGPWRTGTICLDDVTCI